MNECIDTILKKADDCYLKKDYLGAAKKIEEAVASNPDSAELWATWGNVEFQSRNLPEAIVKYREACRLQPQSPDYWTYLAIALLQDGNIEEFESSLESALNIDPFHLDSLKLLGDLCFRNDKKTEAAHSYYKILQKNPDDIEVLMRIGSCLYEGGEVEDQAACGEEHTPAEEPTELAGGRGLLDQGAAGGEAQEDVERRRKDSKQPVVLRTTIPTRTHSAPQLTGRQPRILARH